MIEIFTAACGGFLAGWLMGRLDRETQGDPRRRFRFWRRGSNPPSGPPQPLAADVIRYCQWRNKQIERALRDEPPTPI